MERRLDIVEVVFEDGVEQGHRIVEVGPHLVDFLISQRDARILGDADHIFSGKGHDGSRPPPGSYSVL